MRLKSKYKNDNENNNIFWLTMTDLMTALVLVFIVLFFYTYATSFYEKIQSSLEQKRAAEVLQQVLESQNIKASIDNVTGVVKISDLELFELNSYELSESGKAYLDKFAPAYLNSIFSNKYLNNNIDKIIIQGHTDSQTFYGKYSEDEQYMKNMELSLKRAYAVANYMTNTPYNKANGNRLRKMIIVEGASFSNPVMINGKEDYAKSRRVELKVIMKEKNDFKQNLKLAEAESGEQIDIIEPPKTPDYNNYKKNNSEIINESGVVDSLEEDLENSLYNESNNQLPPAKNL